MINGVEGKGTGILLETSDVVIFNNTCTNFSEGIHLNYVNDCIVVNNHLSNNAYHGLSLRYSLNNLVAHNVFEGNTGYGVLIIRGSYENRLYNNTFLNNSRMESYEWDTIYSYSVTSQARDERRSNSWSDDALKMGNIWSDHVGEGVYHLDGEGEAVDKYPTKVTQNKDSQVEPVIEKNSGVPGYGVELLFFGLIGYIIYRNQNTSNGFA